MNIYQNVSITDTETSNVYNTYDDFGLILKHKDISSPAPDTKLVSVPGRNGSVDYSSILTGHITYRDRIITIKYCLYGSSYDDYYVKISGILNRVHGKRVKIVFDDDTGYYWLGRLQVSSSLDPKGFSPYVEVVMTATVNPYKYSVFTNDSDWLWDPFDFDLGVINEIQNIVCNPMYNTCIDFTTIDSDKISAPIIYSDIDGNTNEYILTKWVTEEGSVRKWRQTISQGTLVNGSQMILDAVLEPNTEYELIINNASEDAFIVSVNYLGGSL